MQRRLSDRAVGDRQRSRKGRSARPPRRGKRGACARPSPAEHQPSPAEHAAGTAETASPPAQGSPPPAAAAPEPGYALGALALVALASVFYIPAIDGGFIWDDAVFSTARVVQQWSGIRNIWLSPADLARESHYWPVVYTTFWLEHKLWGLEPAGYHIVNVALHAAITLLVWRLLRRLAAPGAWAVAAIFATHPLHVESVAWIIERKDLLSALFYLLAVHCWLRFLQSPRPGPWLAALALYGAAILSKSIAVTLPAALLLLAWWKHGRITRLDVLRVAPLFALGASYAAADWAFSRSALPEGHSIGWSPVERVLIAARALWFYAAKLVWPANLQPIYPHWEVHEADWLGWTLLAAALGTLAALWLARKRIGRGPLAGILFFAGTLSPVLGFFDFIWMQYSFVADRFQYLAGVGLMAVVVGGLAALAKRLSGKDGARLGTQVAQIALAASLAILGTATWRHAGIYEDEVTFFSHVVEHNPDARDAHLNLGAALLDAGRDDEGLDMSLVALRKRPDSARTHAQVGWGMLRKERAEEAEAHSRKALAIDPHVRRAARNLGLALHMTGNCEEATEWFRRSIELDAFDEVAYGGLGLCLHDLGRHEAALEAMHHAIALEPALSNDRMLLLASARSLFELGRSEEAGHALAALTQRLPLELEPLLDLLALHRVRPEAAEQALARATGLAAGSPDALRKIADRLRDNRMYERALEVYRQALDAGPDSAAALGGMGEALYHLERFEESIDALGRSLELHAEPPSATARLMLLGAASLELGRDAEAMVHFERAVEMDPRDVDAMDHLAYSRFLNGRHEEALSLYEAVAEARPESGGAHSNVGAVLHHLGRLEDAATRVERALALDPGLDAARTSLADLREELATRGESSE